MTSLSLTTRLTSRETVLGSPVGVAHCHIHPNDVGHEALRLAVKPSSGHKASSTSSNACTIPWLMSKPVLEWPAVFAELRCAGHPKTPVIVCVSLSTPESLVSGSNLAARVSGPELDSSQQLWRTQDDTQYLTTHAATVSSCASYSPRERKLIVVWNH